MSNPNPISRRQDDQALPSRLPEIAPAGDARPVSSHLRRAPTIFERIWTIARRNLGLRIISLLLAVALWLFVNAGERGSAQSFTVPVAYTNLPRHLIITNHHPDSVRINLSGPRTLLSIIRPSHLTVRLDLAGVGVGQASFRIEPDSFSNLPRTTTVTSISPSQVVLDIDRIMIQDFPVHVVTTGSPAAGYHLAAVTTDPSKVKVRGPSRELARFEELDTEPVDLTGLSTNATREVATPAPAPGLRVDSSPVAVSISIAPNIIEKEFRGVPIAVQNTAGQATRTWPSSVALVLRGPQLTLNKLKLDKIVYIDAQGLWAGYYDALLEVNLPDGIELVHQAPEKVKMRIYRGKGPSQGG